MRSMWRVILRTTVIDAIAGCSDSRSALIDRENLNMLIELAGFDLIEGILTAFVNRMVANDWAYEESDLAPWFKHQDCYDNTVVQLGLKRRSSAGKPRRVSPERIAARAEKHRQHQAWLTQKAEQKAAQKAAKAAQHEAQRAELEEQRRQAEAEKYAAGLAAWEAKYASRLSA